MEANIYRASSNRENLEQIKLDLSADAFVLENMPVPIGCFMGLVSGMPIEKSPISPSIAEFTNNRQPITFAPNHRFSATDNVSGEPRAFDNRQIGLRAGIIPSVVAPELSDNFTDDNLEDEIPPVPRILQKEIPSTLFNLESTRIAQPVQGFYQPQAVVVAKPEPNFASRQVVADWQLTARENSSQPVLVSSKSNHTNEVSEPPFDEACIELMAYGVSAEIARKLVLAVIPQYESGEIRSTQIAKAALQMMSPTFVKFAKDPLMGTKPVTLALIGTTGVGKTTTVAKLAARLALRQGRRVELVTLDTYRVAAVEQLKAYAEIIGAGCQVVRSVWELDSTLRKIPSDSCVLIDTTGKNPHDLADQFELSEYLQRRSDIRKCLTLQATINPHDAITAVRKFEMFGVDCLALTKVDETSRLGTVVEIIAESALPLAYLCTGQRVPEDLKVATPENFTARILNSRNPFAVN